MKETVTLCDISPLLELFPELLYISYGINFEFKKVRTRYWLRTQRVVHVVRTSLVTSEIFSGSFYRYPKGLGKMRLWEVQLPDQSCDCGDVTQHIVVSRLSVGRPCFVTELSKSDCIL